MGTKESREYLNYMRNVFKPQKRKVKEMIDKIHDECTMPVLLSMNDLDKLHHEIGVLKDMEKELFKLQKAYERRDIKDVIEMLKS